MPFTVECPCGKSYPKPDHKAGTRFRCHLCGRELTVANGPAARDLETAASSEQITDKAPARRPRPPAEDYVRFPSADPTSIGRTALAWVLIVLGLVGVVGGLGQMYIVSQLEKAMAEEAQAHARMYGQFQAVGRSSAVDTRSAYTAAGGAIGVGVLLGYVGYRLRHA